MTLRLSIQLLLNDSNSSRIFKISWGSAMDRVASHVSEVSKSYIFWKKDELLKFPSIWVLYINKVFLSNNTVVNKFKHTWPI
jgi:hypothetical protein